MYVVCMHGVLVLQVSQHMQHVNFNVGVGLVLASAISDIT